MMVQAVQFMLKKYGEDLCITMCESLENGDVKVNWKDDEYDEETYYSIVGKNKYGMICEKSTGEN